MAAFNKIQTELANSHELKTMGLTHSFAMKMAVMICATVFLTAIVIGVCSMPLLNVTSICFIIIAAIIFSIIAFSTTRSACLV